MSLPDLKAKTRYPRETVIQALSDFYSLRFHGKCWASYDESKRCYCAQGEHLPARPSLRDTYPNGWSLLTYVPAHEAQMITAGKPDARYSIGLEYCGDEEPKYVARFCDEWEGAYDTRLEARQANWEAWCTRNADLHGLIWTPEGDEEKLHPSDNSPSV